ncbi:GNAT family N-acetyltransferase [Cohnella herbarum]|uniref:GNAT family N-acetyltransferase n=1 Tax=Cohnella herbarum TaxID=2728023 RepID=A0A7Z2VGY6_9BACL|nr:GNAT family N-acetyltransferase [Cohnella herbarum]QJD82795.1 GNAT family N-acetyltransferase [Cohnella herbarum]
MDDIVIRELEPGDGKVLADYFRLLSEETRGFFPGYPFTDEESLRIAKEESGHSDFKRYLAISGTDGDGGGKPRAVGTVWFWSWNRAIPWLGISIADDYQGRGLGKRMMKHAIAQARESDKGGILLTTHRDNFRGRALYARCGFEEIGHDDRGEILMLLSY